MARESEREPSLEDWCDLVRGVAGPDRSAALRRVLESKGDASRRQHAAMASVLELAQSREQEAPPDGAVRMAKALFAVHAPTPSPRIRFLPLQLLYDSRLDPTPAGTRHMHSSAIEMHAYNHDFFVVVCLDRQLGRSSRVIVGELLGSETRTPVPNVPVMVTCGSELLQVATTSAFGEFLTEVDEDGDLAVSLLVSETECLSVDIPAIPRNGGSRLGDA